MIDGKLTEADIRRIVQETAQATAEKTVKETFAKLGVDASDPFEAQADFLHLRQWRKSTETIKRQGVLTAIGIVVAGLLALIWQSIKGGTGGP